MARKKIQRGVLVRHVGLWRRMDQTSQESKRLGVAIGRSAGDRLEVALGQEVVMTAKARDDIRTTATVTVEAIVLPFSDEEMNRLASAASASASGADWAEALVVLVRHGVSVAAAGRILGVRQRSEATRLNRIGRWPPALLALARTHELSPHQMRWLDGLSLSQAKEALSKAQEMDKAKEKPEQGDGLKRRKARRVGPTVASIRAAAVTIAGRKTAKGRAKGGVPASPALPNEAEALADGWSLEEKESSRIGAALSTNVRVLFDGKRVELHADYFGAGELAGMLEWLGKGRGDVPETGSKRTLRLQLDSIDELAYLVGSEGD